MIVITIFGDPSDEVGEREHLLEEGTTNFLVDLLADAGITVTNVQAGLVEDDEYDLPSST